ncbi:putative membrane protein YuiB [Lentibacillus sp. JNUCC-1]|uniref:YuiB family protein n=1 Tax=Lentibacillus sp. JNUCC-1 TaxID=2654513 RepID=UPI0012E8AE63|nr:YuiB family protein [Lentibacillus sp. JNUCC-1]MUV39224.1 putative membrane protein YuiB [Lentibacillus sp. JNUCC-1]
MIQAFVEVILFFVMFFGLAFILNMLLRRTWLMSGLYIIIIIIMIDGVSTIEYFTNPKSTFSIAWDKLTGIGAFDYIVFLAGFIGTIVSGIVIKKLRKSGYQMF